MHLPTFYASLSEFLGTGAKFRGVELHVGRRAGDQDDLICLAPRCRCARLAPPADSRNPLFVRRAMQVRGRPVTTRVMCWAAYAPPITRRSEINLAPHPQASAPLRFQFVESTGPPGQGTADRYRHAVRVRAGPNGAETVVGKCQAPGPSDNLCYPYPLYLLKLKF